MSEDKAKRASAFLQRERQRLRDLRKDNSNIPELYFEYSWSSYQPDHDFYKKIEKKNVVESRVKAKEICASYAKSLKIVSSTGKSLFIFGKRSSGKTVLATLILRRAIEVLFESVHYVSFSRFAMEANTANLDDERELFFSRYVDPQFLCIDEVDEIDSNPKIRNYFGAVLTDRQSQKKPTIITSKLPLSKIKEIYGGLVYSAITNQEYFLPPVIIETDEGIYEDTVYIQKNRTYTVSTLIKALQEHKDSKERKKDKKKFADIILADELKNIILSSDRAESVNEHLGH